MAYEIKYRITAATKSDVTSILNIYEDGYAGAIIEYPCINLQIQYIPKSDDAFEPIYVSQLAVAIDVTDDVANMPDFTTLNDRKYFVRLMSGANIDWQGWILSDNVQYIFSTGRKQLAFNAIDGLGILERIPFFITDDTTLVDIFTAIFYIKTALLKLEYPLEYDIVSGVSFYSEGMDNRTDDPSADTLGQSYINYATFIDDNQNATNCLDVLTKIVRSFGSRYSRKDIGMEFVRMSSIIFLYLSSLLAWRGEAVKLNAVFKETEQSFLQSQGYIASCDYQRFHASRLPGRQFHRLEKSTAKANV